MDTGEAQVRQVADAFMESAVTGVWRPALRGLSEICGGRAAELIGVGEAGLEFHASEGLDPDAITEFRDVAGWDPDRNPRVKAGLRAAELQVLSESDYASAEELRRTQIYADQFARFDIPFILQTNLLRRRDSVVGLSVLRGARQGAPEDNDRQAFAAVASAAQGAARLQMAMEGKAAAMLAGAFEALEMAAFICDGQGRVRAMTAQGEALAGGGTHLAFDQGRLCARHPADAPALARALAAVAGEALGSIEIAVRCRTSGLPLLLEVARLPADRCSFRFGARTLVLAKPPRDVARRGALLQAVYSLTPAEADVAMALGRGATVETIAAERDASIGTVRVQMKRIYAKLGVRRQAEVAARLSML